MSKILFVQDIEYEYVGITYLSSMLKSHGHETDMAIAKNFEQIKKEIKKAEPDVIGFSVMTGGHKWAAEMAKKIRENLGIISVIGGAHPTYFPEYIKDEGVEVIIRGEGEFPLLDFMNRIEKGEDYSEIDNLSVKKNGKIIENPIRPIPADLDVYPFPDRHLYDILEKRLDRTVRPVLTSRGCPFTCSFCFAGVQKQIYSVDGKYVRFRSVENVIEELKELKNSVEVNQIYFTDSVFGLNKKWLYRFLKKYKEEIGIDFYGLIRADIVTEEFVKNLKEAGCLKVFFGIEAGNEELRNNVLTKNISNKQIYNAAELLHKYGIKFRAYNILGLPDETLETAYETVQINIDIRTDFPWCSLFSPIPGTKLTQYTLDKGYLDKNFDFDQLPKSYYSVSLLKLPDKHKIENLQKFFQTAVLLPWTFPVIKKLIKLKPNFLFNWWFSIVYFYIYLRAESISFWKTLVFAMSNYRNIITKKKDKKIE